MTEVSVVFAIGLAVGFAVGYAVRAAISLRHRRAAIKRRYLIPACGDTELMRARSVSEQDCRIPLDRQIFFNGCLGGGAGSMSQGLRVLVLYSRGWLNFAFPLL